MEDANPEIIVIDALGYSAAIITNISLYPQAYEVYIILQTSEYFKLQSISVTTYVIQLIGCLFWLIYGIIINTYPIIAGSILCIVPSTYICYFTYNYRDLEIQPATRNEIDDTEIVIASGNNWASDNQ